MRRVPAALAALALGLLVWAAWAPGAAADPAPGRVALIGVPGLHWNDVHPDRTPHLWRLAGQSGLGTLSPRAVATATCPYDAWLTVSAGVRAAVGRRCGSPPEPETQGRGAVVPHFDRLRAEHGAGTLGAAARAAGRCTAAVGPGAALALADGDGRVDVYAPAPAALPAAEWSRCHLLAVDVDDLVRPYLDGGVLTQEPDRLTPAARAAAVAAADAKVGEALGRLPADTIVLLGGLSDHGGVPHLRVAMWRTPGGAGHLVGAVSTHRDHIVLLPDITATVLTQAGVAVPASVIGTPWDLTTAVPRDEAVQVLRRADLAGQTVRNSTGYFFTGVAILQVAFYAGGYVLLRRRRWLGGVRVAALAVASIPVSTSMANLLPWEHADAPTLALIGGVAACTALITLAAVAGPWRRHPLGPASVAAGVTAAVLFGDLLTGTTLQINGLMGYTAVVGGRYYGLGNISFALLATSVFLITTAAAEGLVAAGRRNVAVGLIIGLGGAAMLLDGWPGVGSDFGGVIAFVPGIAVTALLVAGRRVSIVKVGGFCAAGGVLVMAIAYLDHLRPPADQTHLGRFVGQVADGTFLPIIIRKLEAMLRTMLSPNLMPIVITALAFLIFALLRPGVVSAGVVPLVFERFPMLKAGLIGALVCGVVGTLVNDSGIAVLSMVLALAVPLIISVGIGTLQQSGELSPLGPDREAVPGPAGRTGDRDNPPGGTGRDDRVPGFA